MKGTRLDAFEFNKVAKLHDEGLSTAEISYRTSFSHSTINKILRARTLALFTGLDGMADYCRRSKPSYNLIEWTYSVHGKPFPQEIEGFFEDKMRRRTLPENKKIPQNNFDVDRLTGLWLQYVEFLAVQHVKTVLGDENKEFPALEFCGAQDFYFWMKEELTRAEEKAE